MNYLNRLQFSRYDNVTGLKDVHYLKGNLQVLISLRKIRKKVAKSVLEKLQGHFLFRVLSPKKSALIYCVKDLL